MATAAELQYLATVDGESAFFRALCEAQARPVGMHRHFRMLVVQRELYNLTEQTVSIDALWKKFSTYYDIELLEGNVRRNEGHFVSPIQICAPNISLAGIRSWNRGKLDSRSRVPPA